MSDIASLIVRAVVALIDVVMGVFGLLHWSERHQSQSSRVGESRLDREARSWQAWILDSWGWLALALLIIAALIGAALSWF